MAGTRYRLRIGSQEIPLPAGETLVGRSEECGLCLDDERLSRVHAKLVVSGEVIKILDHGSRNGTFVNDVRLTVPVLLRPGDRIRMGQTSMELVVPGRRPRQSSSRTLGGATMLDITALGEDESDVLPRMLQMGRLDEAEKILKTRVANIIRTDPPLGVDHPLARNVVGGLLALTEKSMDARWLHRLFKLHTACGWLMGEEIQKRVEQLIRALGRVGGDGIIEYLAMWTERDHGVTEAEQAQLGRLEQLAKRPSLS